jgi:hypothetical protein
MCLLIFDGCHWHGVVRKDSPSAPLFEHVPWLLRALLNFVAGTFHVLAEAMGCVAPDANDGQERGDE